MPGHRLEDQISRRRLSRADSIFVSMGNLGHHPDMNSLFEKQMPSAIIFASALLILSSIVLLIPISSSGDFLPEQFKEMQMHDSASQRVAHAVWVLLIALTCAFILMTPKQR
jgi:cation transport ATPase